MRHRHVEALADRKGSGLPRKGKRGHQDIEGSSSRLGRW